MATYNPLFNNEDGSITEYSFRCGYVQNKELDGLKTELYHEGCVYHVRQFKDNVRILWETFEDDELDKARTLYSQLGQNHE